MKKIILIIVLIFASTLSFGQNFKELAAYEFKSAESYETEKSKVLMSANYLFTTPADLNELNRLHAIQYIMKWMEGTPEYTFEIGEKAMELTKGNSDLLGLYLAAMTKAVLDNKEKPLSNDEIYNQAEELLVNYCSDSNNKMKPSKKIKSIIKNSKS
ncbi:hypothetical protein [Flavobacterium orientale]|uniref:Uncharacterized protein n=1 Tax=Flavobacterium orientale TaxID=1756020 RepID=A0A916XVD6_9FLAO|nr:hypothetical protein [Flavobacterium orientale]GGD15547.1 hypothetical protein GCM10011343_03100 [Flavobacterium orientale]